MIAQVVYAPRAIAPGETLTVPMSLFLGPKLLEELDAVRVAGQPSRLGYAVDYNFEFLARPMLWVLKRIQAVVVNWGVAIIVVTLLLKLVTLYPTHKSMQSMKQMAKLKPEIDRINKRHPEDAQKRNAETMELYKKFGINPLGGCLPMMIQMPIGLAFYSMLSNAVELYRAPFFGPMNDMTEAFWPLAIATGALTFAQQKLAPQSADPQQKAIMTTMPIMFTALTLFLPSGLALYILTNTVLSMIHQLWMNRNDDPKPGVASAGKKKPAA